MAEASVRPATLDDVAEIARIQRDTWRLAYAQLLPEALLGRLAADDAAFTGEVTDAVAAERTDVLLALEGRWTVGFCVCGPAPESELAAADGTTLRDPERIGLIATLLVEPRWGRRGHGGRLLISATAALRARGLDRAVTWVPERDDVSLSFFTRAGWEPEGTARTLDTGEGTLREVRLGAKLREDA